MHFDVIFIHVGLLNIFPYYINAWLSLIQG